MNPTAAVSWWSGHWCLSIDDGWPRWHGVDGIRWIMAQMESMASMCRGDAAWDCGWRMADGGCGVLDWTDGALKAPKGVAPRCEPPLRTPAANPTPSQSVTIRGQAGLATWQPLGSQSLGSWQPGSTESTFTEPPPILSHAAEAIPCCIKVHMSALQHIYHLSPAIRDSLHHRLIAVPDAAASTLPSLPNVDNLIAARWSRPSGQARGIYIN